MVTEEILVRRDVPSTVEALNKSGMAVLADDARADERGQLNGQAALGVCQGGSRTVPRSRATGFSKTSSGCSRIPPAVADVKRAAMPHGHGIKSPAHQPAAKCNRQKFPAGFGVATNRTRMPGAETCLYAHAYADRQWRKEQFS